MGDTGTVDFLQRRVEELKEKDIKGKARIRRLADQHERAKCGLDILGAEVEMVRKEMAEGEPWNV